MLETWGKRLRITPTWDLKLKLVEDEAWRKSGDIKIDCENRKAVVLINAVNPKWENIEEVIVHELFHLKLYPLDQVTENLISACFETGTDAYEFAMTQFMSALEQTVEEMAKTYLLEHGENRSLSFQNVERKQSFDELYHGLKTLE